MKLQRRKKEGANGAKKSLGGNDVVKPSRTCTSATSTIGVSCLKKSDYETGDSVFDSRRTGSVNTALDSGNEITVTTCESWSRGKKVRFDVVEIRNYERIASDNPCCSSGPPIGIGWKHGKTQRESIDNYEEIRGDRRSNLEIVLDKNERQALLLEWAIDMKTIAESTRAAMKTKFQRKQTVINSRKLSKLEEVSKKLKNVFVQKRKSNGAVAESFASTTSEIYASDNSTRDGHTASITSAGEADKSHLSVTELDDDAIESLMKQSIGVPTADESEGGDESDNFTLGATTLGNSSAFSPSIIEMEKFYRELELEMFGEETELPSMLGQTLEIPQDADATNSNATSADKVKDEDEISVNENSSSYLDSTHLERYPPQSYYHHESQSRYFDYHAPVPSQDPYGTYDVPIVHQQHFAENRFAQPPIAQGGLLPQKMARYEGMPPNLSNNYIAYNESSRHPVSHDAIAQSQNTPVAYGGSQPNIARGPSAFHAPMQSQRDGYGQYRRGRGRSFDSAYDIAPVENTDQYLSASYHEERQHSHFRSQSMQAAPPRNVRNFSVRYSDPGAHYAQRSSRRSSRGRHLDEPRISHMPMHGRLSANEWMDGNDREPSFSNNDITVTITEDDSPEFTKEQY